MKPTRIFDSGYRSEVAFLAKFTVVFTFLLIAVGGLVTSWHAGMAVPDWPLSFGQLNPHGWWENFPVRLEHGHRQIAEGLGLLITVLCALVWRSGWPPFIALLGSAALTFGGHFLHWAPTALMHLAIWSFAGIFLLSLVLLDRMQARSRPSLLRALIFAGFLGVCLQATLGGLRVTTETAGNVPTALVLRITHGCVAQLELCLLVAVAALSSRDWLEGSWRFSGACLPRIRRLAWTGAVLTYFQMIFGAIMRHLGAGLAIPSFPEANPQGGWLPSVHNLYTDLNFLHTRVGSVVTTLVLLSLVWNVMRFAPEQSRLVRPAMLLGALIIGQFALGMQVIWQQKEVWVTTLHVVNGAGVLAATLLLALRSTHFENSGFSINAAAGTRRKVVEASV